MGTIIISNLRLGIPIIGSKIWSGGVTYIELLIKAVTSLPTKDRPKVFLIVSEATIASIDLHEHLLPLLDGLIFIGHDPLSAEKILKRPFIHVSSFDELLREIDFFYPVQSDAWPNVCSASWIPDFQHIHLPEFFSQEEIHSRNTLFQKVASLAKLVVLSSKDAEKDFGNLYPDSKAVARILHFHTMMPDALYEINPADIQHKYNLPEEFLLCSNQFWAHKNHKLVFDALAELNRSGSTIHLVCTGSTDDYRFPEYFKQVKQKLNDLALAERVHILGILPRNDQLQLMRRSLAVVQPSLFEGWSTVVEDARALGKTMILSDLDVHKEQAPDHSVFFERYNSSDLIGKIKHILPTLNPGPDPAYEEQARVQSRENVRSYAMQFCCIAVEALYLFGRSVSDSGKQAHAVSNRDRTNQRDQKHDLGAQISNEINTIDLLIESGNFEGALSALEQAIDKYPGSPDLLNLQAVLKLRMGDKEGAKSIILDLVNRWPTYIAAYNNLACIFWDSGDFENAAKYFEDAIRISQYDRTIVLSYGEMLLNYKKYAKSKEVFETYLIINPNDAEIQSLLKKSTDILEKVMKFKNMVGKKS